MNTSLSGSRSGDNLEEWSPQPFNARCWAKKGQREGIALADLFCREARVRVDRLFDAFYGANDGAMYKVAQQVLRGEHAWLETGIISPLEEAHVEEPVAALSR